MEIFATWSTLKARASCAASGIYWRLAEFVCDTRGSATAIEYALLAAGVGLAGTSAATLLGGEVTELFNSLQNALCMETRTFCLLR